MQILEALNESGEWKGQAFRVVFHILNYANRETGEFFWSVREIAKSLRIRHDTVTDVMSKLESLGFIQDTGQRKGRGAKVWQVDWEFIANTWLPNAPKRAPKRAQTEHIEACSDLEACSDSEGSVLISGSKRAHFGTEACSNRARNPQMESPLLNPKKKLSDRVAAASVASPRQVIDLGGGKKEEPVLTKDIIAAVAKRDKRFRGREESPVESWRWMQQFERKTEELLAENDRLRAQEMRERLLRKRRLGGNANA